MADNKKYYWLKLKTDFFNQKEIKMLRRLAGGDTYTIIYLKMMLLSLGEDGKIYFDNIAKNIVEEIALEIDEETENVQMTVNYLFQKGLIELHEDVNINLLQIPEMVGSETESAKRVRKHRQQKALISEDIEDKRYIVTPMKQIGNTEIEIEIELEKELDKEIDKEKKKKTTTKRFSKPSIDELQQYITENSFNIDAQHFYDYYESKGWLVGKSPMKDWKATVRNWNRRNKDVKQNNFTKIVKKANDEKPPEIEITDEERGALHDRINQGIKF